ncbi:putative ATP-dependent DNA helicase chr12 [Asimina triloba]
MAAQLENPPPLPSSSPLDNMQKTKALICALNLISRNLPLPPDVFDAVSSIYHDGDEASDGSGLLEESSCDGMLAGGGLIADLEDALARQRSNCMSSLALRESEENRQGKGELSDFQRKVRSNVSSEYWLHEKCAYPDKQLFDWGMMRLQRPFILYGVGDVFATEADDRQRKKRDAERLSRFEEEEKNRIETRKRKFFAELLNAAREFQLQVQASLKRRKQRNDGIQAWHARQRQRATRAEKLRIQALKADDQEAYMRMVEESKNERLTMLLGKTNDLLVRLGAAVQRQKDVEHNDGIEPLKDSEMNDPSQVSLSTTDTPVDLVEDEDGDMMDPNSADNVKPKDLLEGQRQYNSVIHSIQEKVTEQPSMLQGGELRPYQLEGLQWMLSLFNNNLNGILADEMGLGKTIQTIALIAYLMENKGVTGPHLIVAPKAVLPNWANEFSTWAPSIVAILYDGRLDERKNLREEYSGEGKFNVMITHYDLIMRDKAFLKKIHWYYMIVDEGHRLKNHECALARTLVGGYRIRRRLLLTVQNFEEWFNAPFADRCDVSLTDEEELLIIHRLHHVIRPFILRRKKNEVEKFLPGKRQVVLKCDMSAWQKAYYQQNLSMQLRKCCNHPYLFVGEYNIWRKEEIIRASGKFELLDRLLPKLQKSSHRVLLFSQMTRLIDILEIYLQLHDFKYLRLDGSTKTEERGSLLKKFNAPDSPYFMFLLSTRAGGLGLNLQTADTVIIFDSDWNPQMDQQAEDRAHRIGQKKEVRVFVLVSVGSIEEEILERAKQKMGIDAKVIQAGLFNTTSTVGELVSAAQDRREMLQAIMRRGTSSLGTDVPSEREINRLAARNEEEFWLFEKMDEERRQRENYRSRLMEEHEVPDWAYAAPDNGERKGKMDADAWTVTGKRRRKEVVYTDLLSDVQWMKAVEEGEDLSKILAKSKRKEQLSEPLESTSNYTEPQEMSEVKDEPDSKNDSESVVSEDYGEEFFGRTPEKHKSRLYQASDIAAEGIESSGWHGDLPTWKTHKRKRSSSRGNGTWS